MKTISIYFWDLNEATQEEFIRAHGVETEEELYELTNFDVLPIAEIYVDTDGEEGASCDKEDEELIEALGEEEETYEQATRTSQCLLRLGTIAHLSPEEQREKIAQWNAEARAEKQGETK